MGYRSLYRTVWVLALCLALSAAPWLPAAEAHAELVSAFPAPGARLTATPAEIRLTFSERLGPSSRIQLFRPQFQPVSQVSSGLDPANPELLRAFPPELPPDIYTVEWQAASFDGHLVSGSYAFEVSALPPAPAPGGSAGLLVVETLVVVGLLLGIGSVVRRRRAQAAVSGR